jgi:uncharacterized membrane protein YkgB
MRSFISTLLILIVSSCTITKRQYTGGYHVEWKSKNHQSNIERVESEEIVSSPELTGVIQSNVSKVDREVIDELVENKIQLNTPAIQPLTAFATNSVEIYKATSGVNETFLHKLNYQQKIKNKKSRKPHGEMFLKTPREYLTSALWGLLIGAVLVVISVLLIVVAEVQGSWGGGIFVYFMFLIGAACLVAVPILLLLALVSFLAGR